MRVCDYIAKRLAAEGISRVFLVQGAANNDLIYAIADEPNIDYTCTHHEQAAGFAAEGWSKVTGKPGCAIATSGPGGQNLVTPIANFWYDSVPGIFITGQVNSKFMKRSQDMRQLGFQEWPASEVMHPITKRSVLITDPKQVPDELEIMLSLCQQGRPGPVLLDIPIDVQRAQIEVKGPYPAPQYAWRNKPSILKLAAQVRNKTLLSVDDTVTQFLDDFWKAERPVLLIGGGCNSEAATHTLNRLLNTLGVPAFPTWNALDVVTSDHPFYGGRVGTYAGPGRNFGIQNSDLLLAIGCRLSGRITGGIPETFARGAKRYTVDIDPELLEPENQDQPFHVNCLSDANEFIRQLYLKTLENPPPVQEFHPGHAHARWLDQVRHWRDKYNPVFLQSADYPRPTPYDFVNDLSELLPSNAIIATDCGGNVVLMNHAFKTKTGQRYFSNNGNSPMGFSFAAAIGAWLAAPERPVICIIGDGGFNLNIQEIQTLKLCGAKVKTFIINNHIYGITKAFQQRHYGDRFEASTAPHYDPPDFVAVATAYGVDAIKLHLDSDFNEPDYDLKYYIRQVLETSNAVICSVECPGYCEYAPRIEGWADPIEDMLPRLPWEEFRQNMIIDPLPGWETGHYTGKLK